MIRLRPVTLALSLVSGCRPASAPEPIVVGPPVRRPVPATTADKSVGILSAHLAVVDAPSLGGDGLVVVFDMEVDAASLHAEAFLVAFGDGGRSTPREATLSPANEDDENRTVLLVGDFGDPVKRPPTDVVVIGNVFTETGEPLRGLSHAVMPFDTGGTVVLAQRLPAGAGELRPVCPNAAQVVRTYWIDGLRGVEQGDLAAIEVELDGGRTVAPTSFDDHDLQDQSREDNVLDLCLAEEAAARRVQIAAGAFTDPAGHPSAAVDIDVQ